MSAGSSGAAGELGAVVIETKLHPPRVRTDLVDRPRLHAKLDGLADRPLILIDAPVGFGKTVLAQSWCATRAEAATVWVSLDAADGDAVRLWLHVASALDRVDRSIGGRALARLRAPEAPVEAAVDELANGLAQFGRQIDIVLDDLHMLSNPASLRPLEQLIDRLPPNARLVVLTRSDPPIRLGRLRARRLLGELRARVLAFTVDEARELLVVRQRIPLDDADVERLVERTEGWPAGLYLASLWLREFDDPARGVRAFSGDQRPVAEYLAGEVLDTLDAGHRDFLVRASVFDRFSASLCDAALERDDSAEMLADLARGNSLIVGLDARDEWFRYHQLFRDLLALELQRTNPSAVAGLHERARAWFAEHGLVEEAIDHAAAAGDGASVVRILREQHMALIRNGRAASLLRWIGVLPPDVLARTPELAATGAMACALLSRPAAERRQFLAVAERVRTEHPARWSPYAAAMTAIARAASIDDDVGSAIAAAREAVELAAAAGGALDVPPLGALAYAEYLRGDVDAAEIAASRAIQHGAATQRPFGLMFALAVLALTEVERGRPFNAHTHAERAVSVAHETQIADASLAGVAFVALAVTHAAEGRWAEAESEAAHAERLRRAPDRNIPHAHSLLVLGEIRLHRGRLIQAAADLEHARQEIDGFPDPGRLPVMVDGLQRALDDARLRSAPGELSEPPSGAELLVLRLLATERSQREIGDALFLSRNTVKSHTRELYRKLGARSREDAVARAAELGLIDEADSPG
jgi:LuxR family maltose regulon positive regulatory protein